MRYIFRFFGVFAVLLLAGAGCLNLPSAADVEPGVEVSEEAPKTQTVTLEEQNDSGQSGTAVLVEENGQTRVTLEVSNTPTDFEVEQPAHIHVNKCETIGGVQFPLENVVNSQSETVLDMTLDEILASSEQLSINVHKSQPEIATYVACGDLKL